MTETGAVMDNKIAPANEAGLDLEAGRLLFARECEFVWAAERLDNLPPPEFPEVAFAGRSNVGKSSLINALTGRNALARTSNTPGRTQQLNFFRLHNRLMLVDMPGYGYAKAPKEQILRWTELISTFLKGRAELRRVCLLIDSRHGVKESDLEMMAMLDAAAVNYQVILTKADKPKSAELQAVVAATMQILRQRVAAHPRILTTSSETGAGLPDLRAELAALAAPPELRYKQSS